MSIRSCTIFTGTCLMAHSLCGVPPVEPRLFFSPSEAPELREVAESERYRPVWNDLLRRAGSFVDPEEPYFRDPQRVLDVLEEGWNLRTRLLRSGRHLAIWGETLGPAALLTGDERYARHGAALTVAMAREWPFDAERFAEVDILGRGEMMRGLALGYDFFNARMTPEERRLVADAAAGYLRDFLDQARPGGAWWYPNSNHLTVAGGAAGLVALALQEAYPDEAPQWIDRCRELIEIWMGSSFDEEGAYSEGASYIEYANVNVALFSHALVRHGGPDLYRHPRIRKAPRFLAMSLVPGTYETEARNSAGFSAYFATPWIQRLAKVNNDGLAAWLWEKRRGPSDYPLVQLDHSGSAGLSFFRILWHHEVAPLPPPEALPLSLRFPGRGLCIWRTGWEEGDVMFSIEAGRYYNVTHDQSDEGHFNLYGYGVRWATDPGTGNQWLDDDRSQALAHSLVFVDEKAQAKSGTGRGTDGEILDYLETAAFSYALADATEAYNRHVSPEERERVAEKGPDHLAAVVRHAHRHALFIRPSGGAFPYAVVIDDVQKDDRLRRYTWQMVTGEAMNPRFEGERATLLPEGEAGESKPRLALFLRAAAEIDWESRLHEFPDSRQPPRIRQIQATTRAANPHFVTALIPLPPGASAPEVAWDSEKRILNVTWPGRIDRIAWSGHRQRPRVELEPRASSDGFSR